MNVTTKAPEQNGDQPTEAEWPVDSFKAAAPLLRRPFTAEAVKFKPLTVTKDGKKTMCAAYIDARLAIERLNLVCPDLWQDAYEPTASGLMWCRLTIDGLTRADVGEGKGKGLVSDALKRAAVHFGVGVSLYAIPKLFLPGKIEALYPFQPQYVELRTVYRNWLEAHGERAFGRPLDHGDVEDPIGDTEAEAADTGGDAQSPPHATAKRRDGQGDGKSSQATASQRRKIHALASGLRLTEPQLRAWIEWNAGTPHTDRIEKAAASKLIEMLEAYDDAAEALSAFNAALEAEDEKAQKIAAKYSGGGDG